MSCNKQLFRNLTSTSTENSLLPQRNAIIDNQILLSKFVCFFYLNNLKNNLIEHLWFMNYLGIFLHQ